MIGRYSPCVADLPQFAILSEPTLLITHPTKPDAVHWEYGVFTPDRRRLGTVRNSDGPTRTPLRNALGLDRRHLDILDADGALVMTLTRAVTLRRFRATVHDDAGGELGRITQKNAGVLTEPRIELESGGVSLASVTLPTRGKWSTRIVDGARAEIAHASVSRTGWIARSDTYVVGFTLPFREPLHSLAFATAIAMIDLRLRTTADAQAMKKQAKRLAREQRWGGE